MLEILCMYHFAANQQLTKTQCELLPHHYPPS